jgi:hypothetical protein
VQIQYRNINMRTHPKTRWNPHPSGLTHGVSVCGFLIFAPVIALAQGQGSWGGGTGFAALLFGVLGFVFLLWVGLVSSIVKGFVSKSRARLLLTIFISCSPLAFCQMNAMRLDYKYKKLVDQRSSLRVKAENYLANKCQADRKPSNRIVINAADGVLLDSGAGAPKFDGMSLVPNLQEIERMHHANSLAGKPVMNIHDQYYSGLSWTSQTYINEALFEVGMNFAEISTSSGFKRRASFDWWKKHTPANVLDPLLKPYDGGIHLRANSPLEFEVNALQSGYVLEFRDISTREDRDNWVARGRMRLIHREDNRPIAEYIGFAAPKYPSLKGDNEGAWGKITVCPGSESLYLAGSRWQPIKFFFNEVVQVK